MDTLVKVVTRNSIVTLISRFAIKLVSFGFTIWIARTLGHEDFGRYALIWSYVTIFATFSDWGLGMYTIRELAKGRSTNKHLAANVIAFRIVLAAATFLLIIGSTQFTGYSSQLMGHIVLASTILFLYAVQDPLDSVLQANERVDLSSILRIFGQLVFVILGTVFLLMGWGITGLIIAALFNVLVSTLLTWRMIQTQLGGLNWNIQPQSWTKLLSVAIPFGLIGFALNWSQKIDIVILSLYRTEDVLGWYNAAYSLILGVSIISNSFNIALYPTMSKEYALNPASVAMINKRVFRYIFMASLPMAIGLVMLGPAIISTLYGSEYLQAAVPLTILAWGVPFIFVSEFMRYRALVGNKEKDAAVAILLASLVNISLNLIFIPTFGLLAAAVTTVFTEALLVVIYLWKLRAEISLLSIGNTFWKPALASAVMAGGLLLFAATPLLPAIALGGTIYLGTLILLGGVSSEETILVRELFKKLLPSVSHS